MDPCFPPQKFASTLAIARRTQANTMHAAGTPALVLLAATLGFLGG